jgi:hypothetical protein
MVYLGLSKMVIVYGYVKLPEGTTWYNVVQHVFWGKERMMSRAKDCMEPSFKVACLIPS